MLARLERFEEQVTLIMSSGVQFLDFGLTLTRNREIGQFIAHETETGAGLLRLVPDQRGTLQRPDNDQSAKAQLQVALDESLRLFDGVWLPVPLLRLNPPYRYANGPETWARARLIALAPPEQDRQGHTHRLTLAIDTTVFEDDPERRYLAPIQPDVQAGATFELAHASQHINWFPALPWVDGWLRECLDEAAATLLHLAPNDLEQAKKTLVHQAHYLNLLAFIAENIQAPKVKLASNRRDDMTTPLNVDMVLDIGNSRSFGILVEHHPKEPDGLKWRYELELRDLSRSEQTYREPFESRVELAQPLFGKENWAARSGRSAAFQWPTIGRVGPEAARLAGARRGTGGATGISSPKRYLWDTERFPTGWRFNSAFGRAALEPKAVAAPISMLVNEEGRALFDLPQAERIPVFKPHYSRSAMMTFMLAEVLAQALRQINSADQRLRMEYSDLPRHLRSIILTIPPSMPKQERDIFENRAREAVGIVWKALRWHPEDDPIEGEGAQSAWPPLPEIKVGWDEATCGQVVYLYNETQNNYGGRTTEFFLRAARRRGPDHGRRLRVATVDIGGGTTDLVINDYLYDPTGGGQNAYLIPEQRFRDGFRIAGDDLVLQLIRTLLMPAFERALKAIGIQDYKPLLARLMGAEHLDVRDRVLRQQLAVQLLYPAGLALLGLCERYDPLDPVRGADVRTLTLGELVTQGGGGAPSPAVSGFIQDLVSAQAGTPGAAFDPLAVRVDVDLAGVHRLFMSDQFELGEPIRSLCEVIDRYDCDVLLLTGRPSRLPGIQSLFRSLLPLPPDRIIPLHHYHTGSWYPFNRRGMIEDPKTTAAVGAMLCLLGQGRLTNFFLHSAAFHPYSTVRHLGIMDNNMVIRAQDLLYSDLRLDQDDYELPQRPFQVLGLTRIGYRQIAVERWAASPLYLVEVDQEQGGPIIAQGKKLLVWLERCPGPGREEYLCVSRVEVEGGHALSRDAVHLQLNTLTTVGLNDDNYWLDSGSIYLPTA
ncbi:virulence factor SrfB [uncultured Thiodictyon sp.]|uniref:virulence factor SrfB n=1 Tax=uncultured Thiodictyon sp. TaxID=1846217 RepID=UPI0025EB468F|nr:virulence factor SrfB [uncultured Thiodictyon sp.]